jgi:hypothetical protein
MAAAKFLDGRKKKVSKPHHRGGGLEDAALIGVLSHLSG